MDKPVMGWVRVRGLTLVELLVAVLAPSRPTDWRSRRW
jgi:Tfp pilus assembly protein PilW